MLVQYWASVADGGPTLYQHWVNMSCLPFTPEFGARFPVSAVWKKQTNFLPHPRVKVSIVGSLRDRKVACSPLLGLRPPGLDFRILCLEDSVISFISPSSGGSPGPVYPICAQRWPDTFHFCIVLYNCLSEDEKLWIKCCSLF